MKKHLFAYALFILLVAWHLKFGIIPAFTHIDSDFPNYLVASRIVASNGDVSKLYDDIWFQGEIYANGINQEGKFSPFPPPTALCMIPLAGLKPQQALQVWTILNLAALAWFIIVLGKLSNKPFLWVANVVLLSGLALSNNFRLGQLYLLLGLSVAAAFLLLLKPRANRRRYLAGGLLGLGASIKYFPVLYGVQFLRERRKTELLSAAATVAVIYILTGFVLGFDVYRAFFSQVLGKHLSGDIQDPFSSTFQSFNSLLRRLFIADPLRNPSPLFSSSAGFYISLSAIIIMTCGITFKTLKTIGTGQSPQARLAECALLTITGMVLLPASATYHYLLLIMPVIIILSAPETQDSWEARSILVIYAIIGFLPYHLFRTFENSDRTGLFHTVMAYPRLWLTVGIFILANSLFRKVFVARSDKIENYESVVIK